MFEDVGRGLALALADLTACNPQCVHCPCRHSVNTACCSSRLPKSEYGSLAGVRKAVAAYVKSHASKG